MNNSQKTRAEKWSKNGSKIDPKIDPEIGDPQTETPSNEACFRKMAEKWPSKTGRKIVFSRSKKWSENGQKMAQKSAQNRGRKMAYQAQTTLKIEKMGQKNDLEKWVEKWLEKWAKMGPKMAQKIDKIEDRKIGFSETKPKLRLKSKNGPGNSL